MARAIDSVPEMVVQGIFPWCFTPELYAQKPDYIQTRSDFARAAWRSALQKPKRPKRCWSNMIAICATQIRKPRPGRRMSTSRASTRGSHKPLRLSLPW